MIIIPIKWLFHWEYTQHFQTNPCFFLGCRGTQSAFKTLGQGRAGTGPPTPPGRSRSNSGPPQTFADSDGFSPFKGPSTGHHNNYTKLYIYIYKICTYLVYKILSPSIFPSHQPDGDSVRPNVLPVCAVPI